MTIKKKIEVGDLCETCGVGDIIKPPVDKDSIPYLECDICGEKILLVEEIANVLANFINEEYEDQDDLLDLDSTD